MVTTPNSVASKAAPDKDVVLITIDKEGKVFLSIDDKNIKASMADYLNDNKKLNINKAAFQNAAFVGAPFSQLSAFLQIPEEQRKGSVLPGIPVDSTKGPNEMTEWMRVVAQVYYQEGKKVNLLLKGDNNSKYPSFKSVIDAFKKNDLMKFQMVTNPESAPIGSELWKSIRKGEKQDI